MLQLSSDERRALRARAHTLSPVVSISENGVTDAVIREIEVNLKAHELIKIRVYGDSRENREAYLEKICQELGAATVQHIGKLLVIFRPNPDLDSKSKTAAGKQATAQSNGPRKTKRSFQG